MNHNTAIRPFSADPDFDFEIRCALGKSPNAIGEILASTWSVGKGDHEAWSAAWTRLAERTLATAVTSAAGEHRQSAAEAYLRASAYYAVAVNALSALDEPGRLDEAFALQQDAWSGFVTNTPIRVTAVEIPYEGRHLRGWFARPTAPTGATVVAVNGSDGSLASLWTGCVVPGVERGYNVLIFDGPGQQSELFEGRSLFRHDWEHVLTPVYDFTSGLEGVAPGRVGLYGISQGSYWVARALAFEHRYAAAVVDPGIVDVSTSWMGHLPKALTRLLDAGDLAKFDRDMTLAMRFSPTTARLWRFRARPYGTAGYGETIEAVRQYNVSDVAGRINTPLLILSPDGEQFWPGQADQLAQLTGGVSSLVRFTAAEGAEGHCQPLAGALTAQRMFDWLDESLSTEV